MMLPAKPRRLLADVLRTALTVVLLLVSVNAAACNLLNPKPTNNNLPSSNGSDDSWGSSTSQPSQTGTPGQETTPPLKPEQPVLTTLPYSWVDDMRFNDLSPIQQLDVLQVRELSGETACSFHAVATAADGDIYVVGQSDSKAVIIKYNNQLVEQKRLYWEKNDNAVFNDIAVAADGSVYVAGRTTTTANYRLEAVVVSFDSNLVQQQAVVWYSPQFSMAFAVEVAKNGDVFVVGIADASSRVIRYRPDLTEQSSLDWRKGDGSSCLMALALAADGSVYAAGYHIGTQATDFMTPVILKLTDNLEVVTDVAWSGDGHGMLTGLAVTTDGMVFAVGSTGITIQQSSGATSKSEGLILKFDKDLTLQAPVTWKHSTVDTFSDVVIGREGYVFAAGHTNVENSSNNHGLVVRYDSNLKEINTNIWKGSEIYKFYGIAIGPDNSVYIVGTATDVAILVK